MPTDLRGPVGVDISQVTPKFTVTPKASVGAGFQPALFLCHGGCQNEWATREEAQPGSSGRPTSVLADTNLVYECEGGLQTRPYEAVRFWIPAFAGVTEAMRPG